MTMNGLGIFTLNRVVTFVPSTNSNHATFGFGLRHCVLLIDRVSAYTPVLRIQIQSGKGKSYKRIAIKSLDVKSALAEAILFIFEQRSLIDGVNHLTSQNQELHDALAWSQLEETEESFIQMIYQLASDIKPSLLRKHGFNISDSITINSKKYAPRYFSVVKHKRFKSMELKNAPTIRINGQSYGKNAKSFRDLTEVCAMFVAQNFYVGTVAPCWRHAYIISVYLHVNGLWQSKMISHCHLPYRQDLALTTFYNLIFKQLNDLKAKKPTTYRHVTKRRKQ